MNKLKIWFEKSTGKNEEKRLREQEHLSKKAERLLKEKKLHDEFIAEWDEEMKSIKGGTKVKYLGIKMVVVSVWRPRDFEKLEMRSSSFGLVLCEYVDKRGKIQPKEFEGRNAYVLSIL